MKFYPDKFHDGSTSKVSWHNKDGTFHIQRFVFKYKREGIVVAEPYFVGYLASDGKRLTQHERTLEFAINSIEYTQRGEK